MNYSEFVNLSRQNRVDEGLIWNNGNSVCFWREGNVLKLKINFKHPSKMRASFIVLIHFFLKQIYTGRISQYFSKVSDLVSP